MYVESRHIGICKAINYVGVVRIQYNMWLML